MHVHTCVCVYALSEKCTQLLKVVSSEVEHVASFFLISISWFSPMDIYCISKSIDVSFFFFTMKYSRHWNGSPIFLPPPLPPCHLFLMIDFCGPFRSPLLHSCAGLLLGNKHFYWLLVSRQHSLAMLHCSTICCEIISIQGNNQVSCESKTGLVQTTGRLGEHIASSHWVINKVLQSKRAGALLTQIISLRNRLYGLICDRQGLLTP